MDIKEIEKLFSDKLAFYAKEYGVGYRDIQVLLIPNADEQIEYKLYVQGEFKKNLSLQHDILNIKLDFLNKTLIIGSGLKFILGVLSQELGCEKSEVSVLLVAQSDEDPTVNLALQKSLEFVRWLDLESELNL